MSFFLAAFVILAVAYIPAKPPTTGVSKVASTAPPITRPMIKAMFFGDSVVAGAASSVSNRSFARLTGAAMNWDVSLDAVGGAGYLSRGSKADELGDRSMRTRLEAVIGAKPDVVIVGAGRNDGGMSMALLGPAITDFYKQMRARLPEAKILIITPWSWDLRSDDVSRERVAEITAVLKESASEIKATLIDQRGLIRITQSNVKSLTGQDQWHPNDAGHDVMARALVGKLLDLGLPLGPQDWKEEPVLSGKWVDGVASGASEFAQRPS